MITDIEQREESCKTCLYQDSGFCWCTLTTKEIRSIDTLEKCTFYEFYPNY